MPPNSGKLFKSVESGHSSSVEYELPKLGRWVRFPLPAPFDSRKELFCSSFFCVLILVVLILVDSITRPD